MFGLLFFIIIICFYKNNNLEGLEIFYFILQKILFSVSFELLKHKHNKSVRADVHKNNKKTQFLFTKITKEEPIDQGLLGKF